MKQGMVYLVGAGPGDPGLLTVKGRQCLEEAEAVVYDFLANPALLAWASPKAEIHYVGKKGSDHTLSQSGINELLVGLAQKGLKVVRLKGGDPFIFGRGGEEAEELAEAGIPFQVVPGVTSTIAAPAYAGIPLTHRRHTVSVGFVTGHEDPTKPVSHLQWDHLAQGLGTLVFVMGVKNLPDISANLIRGGKSPSTPAALVRWGTTPDQETVTGTLADIADIAKAKGLKPPAVLVVGGVVGLRAKLNWFEALPLFGKRILVTRTRQQASRLTRDLSALGALVVECPTIRIEPPEDWTPVDQAIDHLDRYDWLILTSPNGVDALTRRLLDRGRDARALAGLKIAAIGPATRDKLLGFGLAPDLVPEEFVAEGLIRALKAGPLEGKRFLIARAAEARDVLPQELTQAGAQVEVVALYRTLPPEDLTPEAVKALEDGALDLATFTSSSTASNLAALLGDRLPGFVEKIPAAVIGPVTARTARDLGLSVIAEANPYTIDGLVQAIVGALGK